MTETRTLAPVKLAMISVLIILLLAAAVSGIRLFWLDMQYRQASGEIERWGSEGYVPPHALREQVGRNLVNLVSSAPRQPDYLSLQGSYQAWRAYYADDVDQRIELNNQAMASLYQALESRPAHRHSWRKMIEYAAWSTSGAPVLAEAQRRLELLAPEGLLQTEE